MPWWEALQLTLGLLIPPLIAIHVIGTRVAQSLLGFDIDYPWVLYVQWSGVRYLIQQPLLVLVVWTHMAIGLHYWLRLKGWYPRVLPLLYALAVVLPVLALLGFARAGTEVLDLASDPAVRDRIVSGWSGAPADERQFILSLEPWAFWVMGALRGRGRGPRRPDRARGPPRRRRSPRLGLRRARPLHHLPRACGHWPGRPPGAR